MMPAGVGGGATRRELSASEASNLPWGTTMSKKILPLIGMALLSGPLAAQAPVAEFVSTIESGGYAAYVSPFPVLSWRPLDCAMSAYLLDPTKPVFPNITLEQNLYFYLQGFAAYWAFAGSSASLFDPFNRYLDSPPHIAHYLVYDIVNTEDANPQAYTKAPELDASSMASGLTLFLGGLVVLRGRRPARPVV